MKILIIGDGELFQSTMNPDFLFNLTRLTGWLAAAFLFLNFLTCWVMPWAKRCRDLICKVEGVKEEPKSLCYYHKILVWPAIIFTLIHIILAIIF